jgi:hypothetical protein
VRILALLSLVLTAVCAFGITSPALAQEPARPVVAPEFAASFPALLPIEPTASEDPSPTASGALGPDGRALVAATYWLLLGALALRRVTRRAPDPVPVPASGWEFGTAPPVPRY